VGEGDHVEKGDVLARFCTGHAVPVLVMICAIRSAALKSARLRLEAELGGQYDFGRADAYSKRAP